MNLTNCVHPGHSPFCSHGPLKVLTFTTCKNIASSLIPALIEDLFCALLALIEIPLLCIFGGLIEAQFYAYLGCELPLLSC